MIYLISIFYTSKDYSAYYLSGFANLRIGMLEGDMDKGYVSVGNGISHIHEIVSCATIVDELTKNWKG
jgi:enoyl-[acyl-carrier protein] reductase II